MEVQFVTLIQQSADEVMPRIMSHYVTPGGVSILFLPAVTVEILSFIRDRLTEDVARMESERAMLKAMAPPANLQ